MKYLTLSLAFFIAVFAGQAHALTLAEPVTCTSANAQTDVCKIQASCGGLQDQLTRMIGQKWALENRLILPEGGSYTPAQRIAARQLTSLDRAISSLRAAYNRCAARAVR